MPKLADTMSDFVKKLTKLQAQNQAAQGGQGAQGGMGSMAGALGGMPQQLAPQSIQEMLTPQQVQQNVLGQLQQQMAPANTSLAAEQADRLRQAGSLMGKFYTEPMEYDPATKLGILSSQHANLMADWSQIEDMQQSRQTTLKEVAEAASTGYAQYLEQANQQKQLAYMKRQIKLDERKQKWEEKQTGKGDEIKAAEKAEYLKTKMEIDKSVLVMVSTYRDQIDSLDESEVPKAQKDLLSDIGIATRGLKKKDRDDILQQVKTAIGYVEPAKTKKKKKSVAYKIPVDISSMPQGLGLAAAVGPLGMAGYATRYPEMIDYIKKQYNKSGL